MIIVNFIGLNQGECACVDVMIIVMNEDPEQDDNGTAGQGTEQLSISRIILTNAVNPCLSFHVNSSEFVKVAGELICVATFHTLQLHLDPIPI